MNKILTYGNPALNRPCAAIEDIDSKVHLLIQNLSRILQGTPDAVGLAANQIGSALCVFVYKTGTKILPIINPRILGCGDSVIEVEGCLSFPKSWALIKRHKEIEVEFLDFYSLSTRKVSLDGFVSRLFQHEIEHLSGKTMIDNLTFEERHEFLERFARVNRSTKNSS